MENKDYSRDGYSRSQKGDNYKKKQYSSNGNYEKKDYNGSSSYKKSNQNTYNNGSSYKKKDYGQGNGYNQERQGQNSYKKKEYNGNSYGNKPYNNGNRYNSDKGDSGYNANGNNKRYNADRNSNYNSDGNNRRYNADRGNNTYNADKEGNRYNANKGDNRKPYNPNFKQNNGYKKPYVKKNYNNNRYQQEAYNPAIEEQEPTEIRLNRYIANAGICSRRNADVYIAAGNVTVNGQVMTTLGYRVQPTDEVRFDGRLLSGEKKEYILLNKPKGFITTTDDEKGRKTVMDLVTNATRARIVPVGRLDRPTTGLLLLTNDGDLLKRLTHPSFGVRKIYHVALDRKLDYKDFLQIEEGLELEDGFIKVDEISYVEGKPKNELGIKIHSGRNRIVRRIFEHLGYNVEKLDRVVFAGLTKKDLPRGHWRRLTQQEVINLKNLS